MPVESVTVSGSVVKRVKCEKCGRDYGYRMSRQETRRPEGHVPLLAAALTGGIVWVVVAAIWNATRGDPEATAKARATKGLANRLAKRCDPVPCPGCGWYQPEMVREARRRLHPWINGLAATLLTLGTSGALITQVYMATVNSPGATAPMLFDAFAGAVAGGLGLLVLRWLMQRGYNINKGYPSARPPYPGSPAAVEADQLPADETGGGNDVGRIHDALVRSAAAADPIASRCWYYSHGGKETGPVSWATRKRLADVGILESQDRVRGERYADWTEATAVPGLLSAEPVE